MSAGGSNPGMSGFTLIELLVALAISALVAVMAYSGLSSAMSARESMQRDEKALAELQVFFQLIGRDLRHAATRPITNEFGDREPALRAEYAAVTRLQLTRSGWSNPAASPRSNLQRVSWRLEGENLLRGYWPVLDRAEQLAPIERVVLGGVEDMELYFRPADQGETEWLDHWPPEDAALDTLPAAVRVVLQLEHFGRVERLFLPVTER